MARGIGRPERWHSRPLGRMLRGMRPDRNPLRRTTDRLETYLLRAQIVQVVLDPNSAYTLNTDESAEATWTSATGVRNTGQVLAPDGTRKGSIIAVWTDDAGNLVSAPLLTSQVSGDGQLAAFGAVTGLGVCYLGSAAAARLVLRRRQMAAWDADWLVTAQAWNRRSW